MRTSKTRKVTTDVPYETYAYAPDLQATSLADTLQLRINAGDNHIAGKTAIWDKRQIDKRYRKSDVPAKQPSERVG